MTKNSKTAGAAPTKDVGKQTADQVAAQATEQSVGTSAEQLAATDEAPQPDPQADKPAAKVKARVLMDCIYGKCDEVVTLDADAAASAVGMVDTDPAAVAYAQSLAKAK